MKWLILGLLALGLTLTGFGFSITQGSGSADERVGGTLPILLGGAIIIGAVVGAFVWVVFRA